jgi:hypothetical protein
VKYLVLLVICVLVAGVLAVNMHTVVVQNRCVPVAPEVGTVETVSD